MSVKVSFKVEAGKVPLVGRAVAVVDLAITRATPSTHHTVLVLDCSTSMTGSIDRVREDSQRYVAELGDDNFVSVIIFSGHRTCKLIAGPTQTNAKGRELVGRAIEREVRLIGTTVFSEPLSLALETIKRQSGPDTVHNAVLFTDGCAVPTEWSVDQEQKKAIVVARQLADFGAVVSVVGYGVYYNDAFIRKLMAEAGNSGVYRHISEIEEFGAAIQAIKEVFERTALVEVDLEFAIPGVGSGRIFRTTPEVSLVANFGLFRLRGLYDSRATFFIEFSGACKSLTVKGSVGGVKQDQKLSVEALSAEGATDFIRVLAAHAVISGNHVDSAELFGRTGDTGLAEKAACAYTNREQREVSDLSRRYFIDRKFIGAGLKPTGPSHCVLNVLRALIEDTDNIVFIPKGAYKRSGELTVDSRIVHPPGRTLRVVDYTSHDNRFNFSLRTLKDVKVRPESGKGPLQDMKIWRTYNVVLDGNLHLPELEATLSEETFKTLQKAGVVDAAVSYDASQIYTINLRNLKMVSPNWANPATLGLVSLMREEKELEAEQKALNARRKEIGIPDKGDADGDIYYEKAEKVEGQPVERYWAPCVEYRLMGYKAKDYEAACAKMKYVAADARVKAVRQRLTVVRYLIRSIVFAMEATGSKTIKWDADKTTKRGEWSKLEQEATFQGADLKRASWQEELVRS